jgi:hypothetical protein
MVTKDRKMVFGAGLLVCLFCSIVGYLGIRMMTKAADNGSKKLPTSKVTITIDVSHQQEFFDQLRKFAAQHDFTIRIDAQPSGDEDFLIYMTREDMIISGLNVFAPGEYRLGFYDADRGHPVSESVVDELVSDLQNFVSKVPDTTFSMEK